MLHTGVDMIEIERVRTAVNKHGERFLTRVYTATERQLCARRMDSLAGRFAAKEAVAKALGTGIWRHGILWTDIEIDRDPTSGQPRLRLHGRARTRSQEMGIAEWSLSISHDRSRAVAFVVARSD